MPKNNTSKAKPRQPRTSKKRTQKAQSKAHHSKGLGKSLRGKLHSMYAPQRIKAFITDMFMVNMPLLYFTTYVFLDGKEAFVQNQNVILACSLIYGVVLSLFFAFSSQTPGYRYVGLKLTRFSDENKERKIGFIRALIRYILWIVGTSFLFGILTGVFRKDGRCLHDVLCDTQVIEDER